MWCVLYHTTCFVSQTHTDSFQRRCQRQSRDYLKDATAIYNCVVSKHRLILEKSIDSLCYGSGNFVLLNEGRCGRCEETRRIEIREQIRSGREPQRGLMQVRMYTSLKTQTKTGGSRENNSHEIFLHNKKNAIGSSLLNADQHMSVDRQCRPTYVSRQTMHAVFSCCCQRSPHSPSKQ
jgi:hypothetical protein